MPLKTIGKNFTRQIEPPAVQRYTVRPFGHGQLRSRAAVRRNGKTLQPIVNY
jgi:hypothetical protein